MTQLYKHLFIPLPILLAVLLLSGCAATSKSQLLQSNDSQVMLRSIQTRAFDTSDKEKTMRTTISTLQDLDFVIRSANSDVGTISGTKFVAGNALNMTVTVRPRGETQMLVRANAQWGIKAVEDPETYQDFFTSLEKAIFLTAHQID